jgi:transketolase
MAIAEAHLANIYNRPALDIVNHNIYALVTDGDLMEGVASEAASLAGHLKLGKLIYIYDDNRISIDGSTDLSFTEDRGARFSAYGWQVLNVDDGNDVEKIDSAIRTAKKDFRPSIIICKTQIGFGLPTRQGTAKAHGEPPGDVELNAAKQIFNWPQEPKFFVPDEVSDFFRQIGDKGRILESDWISKFEKYQNTYPDLAMDFNRRIKGELPTDWDKNIQDFPSDPQGMATRSASGKAINAIADCVPELVGGSADLTPSNNTWILSSHGFQPDHYDGRYFHFGVREHAMGAVVNGMAVHKGLIPFGATFLVFSDYMRPAIRLSALSNIPSIWVFTHDSIGLGEDGPTHQPVEHLASLRAIPGLVVIRPADANEVNEAWRVAITRRNGPTLLTFSRQIVPVFDRAIMNPAAGLSKGAYIMRDFGGKTPQIIIMATGTEVAIAYEACQQLSTNGVPARLVSFPSFELFEMQDDSYKNLVFPLSISRRIAIEAGISQGWEKWVGDKGRIISVNHFGASAPYKILYEQFGLTSSNIISHANELLSH